MNMNDYDIEDFNGNTYTKYHTQEEINENQENYNVLPVKTGIGFYRCFKTAFQYAGGAGVISALATTSLDLIGKIFGDFPVFIGKHQLIDGSSFLTGGFSFFAFEAASELTKSCLGKDFLVNKKVIALTLSHLSGIAATVAFAYLTSVPVITALVFVALGVASRETLKFMEKQLFSGGFTVDRKAYEKVHGNLDVHDGDRVKIALVSSVSSIASSCAAGGLICEGGVRIVSWLTGVNGISIGLRQAAWSGVLGMGVFFVAGLVSFIILVILPSISKEDNKNFYVKMAAAIVVGFAVSCYVNPVPALVNAIMLGSSLLAELAMV